MEKIKRFYFEKSLYYFGFVSWNDFITVKGSDKNKLVKFLYKIQFSIKSLFSK